MQPYSPSWQRRRAASTWGGQITYRCRRCGAAFNFEGDAFNFELTEKQ